LEVASGETQTVIFKVSQKDSCCQNMSPSTSSDSLATLEAFAETLSRTVPPATLSGDFVSPVDIRWSEASPPVGAGADTSCGRRDTTTREEADTGAECTCAYACADNAISMHSTVPIYWELDRREGSEFIVDITGPQEGRLHQPIMLQVISLSEALLRSFNHVFLAPRVSSRTVILSCCVHAGVPTVINHKPHPREA
jgi:hypothetical protein